MKEQEGRFHRLLNDYPAIRIYVWNDSKKVLSGHLLVIAHKFLCRPAVLAFDSTRKFDVSLG
jgi:hypothetical protein